MLAKLLILPIRFYQKFISPSLGHNCLFLPTCSSYAIEALQVHGALKGLLLAVWRILRCNPFNTGGYDPVPPKGKWKHEKAFKLSRQEQNTQAHRHSQDCQHSHTHQHSGGDEGEAQELQDSQDL